MSKVYFAKGIEKILKSIDYSKLGKRVAIKVHFGEIGCNTHLDPELARKVYEKIKSLGKEPKLVECNVLYKGNRTTRDEHIEVARKHGFTDMDIEILDGEKGESFIEINGCKIGKGLENYDSIIFLTHFKGHGFAGFGGAIKNVGMGLGSRAGKLYMHSDLKPHISEENCIGCGICMGNCNANAISIDSGKARINPEICEGCAMCIAVCPTRAAEVPWEGGSADRLQEKIAEYAAAVLNKFPNSVFINVLQNITVHCDCMGIEQSPIMEDVGFLYSEDAVATDRASLDLANKFSDGNFDKINEIDKFRQLKFTEKFGLGDGKYELENI